MFELIKRKIEQGIANKSIQGKEDYSEKISALRTYYNGFNVDELEIIRIKMEEMLIARKEHFLGIETPVIVGLLAVSFTPLTSLVASIPSTVMSVILRALDYTNINQISHQDVIDNLKNLTTKMILDTSNYLAKITYILIAVTMLILIESFIRNKIRILELSELNTRLNVVNNVIKSKQ